MNEIIVIFLGNLIGASFGPLVFQRVLWFNAERFLATLLFLSGAFIARKRVVLWTFGMMIWMFAHNPASWDLGTEGEVVRANGCGFVNDDLLIVSTGLIQMVRGRGAEGDIVRKEPVPAGLTDQITSRVQTPNVVTSRTCNWSGKFRKLLLEKLDRWSRGRREWLQSFVLGADMKLDGVTTGALRRLGLLHIVVLSGSHLSILSLFALFSLRFIPLVLFNLRIISMRTWPFIWTITALFGVLGLWLFSMTVGMPQTVQRALVLCVVIQLSELFYVKRSMGETLLLVWLVQSLLFPINVFSLSMYLSWSGSLILSGLLTSHFRKSWFEIFRERILIQIAFAVCSLFVFGTISLLSVVVNIALGPVFSLLLPANFILLFGLPHSVAAVWLVDFQMLILDILRQIDAWQTEYPWMQLTLPKRTSWLVVAMKAFQILILLLLMARVMERTIKRRRDSHKI